MDNWQRAFVLHRWLYSETSLLIDLFSEHHGRIKVMAKGARSRRSSLKGILQPFTPLLVRWRGRGEIKTLCDAEAASLAIPLNGQKLYCALYINELLSRLLEQEISSNTLFFEYLDCIKTLAENSHPEPVLRQFEFALLHHLGYGIDFLHCANGEIIEDGMNYHWQEEHGFIASVLINQFSFTGRQLRAFGERDFSDSHTLKAAKRLTRLILRPRLNGKPLKSQELFRLYK